MKELLESMASGPMCRLLVLPFLIVPIVIYLILKNAGSKESSKSPANKSEREEESR
jgi:hypothetical protein